MDTENNLENNLNEISFLRQKTFNPALRELINDIREVEEGEQNRTVLRRHREEHALDYLLRIYWENELILYRSVECINKMEQVNQEELIVLVGQWKEIIENIDNQKWNRSDILSLILDKVWANQFDSHKRNVLFSQIAESVMPLFQANKMAVMIFSPLANAYRIIIQSGMDDLTKINLAFIPRETIIQNFFQDNKPLIIHFNESRNDPYLRKKFSPTIWAEKNSAVIFPVLSDFTDLKPKNLMLILYIAPDIRDMSLSDTIIDRIHAFLMNFFPIIEMIESVKLHGPKNDLIEEVHNYFLDRRLYHGSEVNKFSLIVIQFQIWNENPRIVRSIFHFLASKLKEKLSHLSKILRHSFNEGYILLHGNDISRWPEIEKIMVNYPVRVTHEIKKFPEHGFNLFNYQ